MIPDSLSVLDRWPLKANGKIDRDALPEPSLTPRTEKSTIAPRTKTECLIASIWSEVLQNEHLGVADNFFDLGGDSLRSIRVQGRLTERLGRPVALLDLFTYPTIRELARFLDGTAAPQGRASSRVHATATDVHQRLARLQTKTRAARLAPARH